MDSQSFSLRADLRSVLIRKEVFHQPLKVGQGVFVDLGRIGGSVDQLISGRNHAAVGFSLFGSYFTDDFINNADFGFSEDGFNFYVGLGHAF